MESRLERFHLRWYQREAVEHILAAFWEDKKKVIVEIPTGGGKTLTCFALLDKLLQHPSAQGMIVLPSIMLVEQTYREILKWFPQEDVGLVWDYHNQLGRRITIASIDTIEQDYRLIQMQEAMGKGFDIVIYDEAHGVLCNKYQKVACMLEHKNTLRVGMTATPYRYDKKNLLLFFEDGMVYYVDMLDLIAEGYLVRPIPYLVQTDLDLSAHASEAERQAHRYERAYQSWIHFLKGRRTIYFGSSVADAYRFRDYLTQHDVWCEVITDHTSTENRENWLKAAEAGHLVLANYDVLTTGVDMPWLEGIIIGRTSLMGAHPNIGKHTQIVGRGLRPWREEREDGLSMKEECGIVYLTDKEHPYPPVLMSMGILIGSLVERYNTQRKKASNEDKEKEEEYKESDETLLATGELLEEELLSSSEADVDPEEQRRVQRAMLEVHLKEMRAKQFDLFSDKGWVRDALYPIYQRSTEFGTLIAEPSGPGTYQLKLRHPNGRSTLLTDPTRLYTANDVIARGTQWHKRKQEIEKMQKGMKTASSDTFINAQERAYLKQRRIPIKDTPVVTQGMYQQVLAYLKEKGSNYTDSVIGIADGRVYVAPYHKPNRTHTRSRPTSSTSS